VVSFARAECAQAACYFVAGTRVTTRLTALGSLRIAKAIRSRRPEVRSTRPPRYPDHQIEDIVSAAVIVTVGVNESFG
jgi:hypothetical protein